MSGDFQPDKWFVFVTPETNPGTTPDSAEFTFVGGAYMAPVSPNPNYVQIKSAGKTPTSAYANLLMSVKPTVTLKLVLSDIDILVDYVSKEQAFTALLYNTSDGEILRLSGSYVKRLVLDATADGIAQSTLDLWLYRIYNTSPPGTPSIPTVDISTLTDIPFANLSVIKNSFAIDNLQRIQFQLIRNLKRLLNSVTGETRAIYHIGFLVHKLTLQQAITNGSAYEEIGEVYADTSNTVQLNVPGKNEGWAVKIVDAKIISFEIDPLNRPLKVLPYKTIVISGTDLEFLTIPGATQLLPAPALSVQFEEDFTEPPLIEQINEQFTEPPLTEQFSESFTSPPLAEQFSEPFAS